MLDSKPGRNCQVSWFGTAFRLVFFATHSMPIHSSPASAPQATNFLRAFRTLPQAAGLSLILDDEKAASPQTNMPALIQQWHIFVMSQRMSTHGS
jgi:hypothetical protein